MVISSPVVRLQTEAKKGRKQRHTVLVEFLAAELKPEAIVSLSKSPTASIWWLLPAKQAQLGPGICVVWYRRSSINLD